MDCNYNDSFFVASARHRGGLDKKERFQSENQPAAWAPCWWGDKWEVLKQHWRQRPIMQSVKTNSQGKKKKMKSKKKDRPDAKPLVVAI